MTTSTACRDCGAAIDFRLTAAQRWQAIDPATAEPHGATCQARRRRELPDDVCHRCGSLAVRRGAGTGIHFASLRCDDGGTFRWLRGGS